jgi:hypothetical protein
MARLHRKGLVEFVLKAELNGARSRCQPFEPAKIRVRAISRVGNPAITIAGIHPVEDVGGFNKDAQGCITNQDLFLETQVNIPELLASPAGICFYACCSPPPGEIANTIGLARASGCNTGQPQAPPGQGINARDNNTVMLVRSIRIKGHVANIYIVEIIVLQSLLPGICQRIGNVQAPAVFPL